MHKSMQVKINEGASKKAYLTKQELLEIKKIQHSSFKVSIDPYKLKYKKPHYSIQECITNYKNYSISIYVPMKIKYKKMEIFQNKYVLIGEIPLMTEKGTFIVNGKKRVIVNQIVRSPGIYFEKNKKDNSIVGTIIPNEGSWLSIKLEKEGSINVKIDKMRNKIPVLTLLQAMGLSSKKILYSIKNKEFLISITNTKITSSVQKALKKMNDIMFYKQSNLNNARNFIYTRFMDKNKYQLGDIGRIKLNTKLYKKQFWENNEKLKPEDILGAVNYLINLNYGAENLDDIDDLKNKRIRSTGELLQNQLKTVTSEIIKNIKLKLEKIEEKFQTQKGNMKINQVMNIYTLTRSIKKFFTSNQLSQLMEETNSLSEITHKRKINSFGTGGIDRKKANLNVRKIHPSQYGRICPIETTEGKNAGLILSLAQDVNISKYGFIESPYYKIVKSRIKSTRGIYYISSQQEKQLFLAPGDIYINKKENKNPVSIRKNKELINKRISEINYISTSPSQIISIGTSLIPFLEHNDANRALMGSNMQRQAVPLTEKEIPIIQTGLEKKVAKDSELTVIAKNSGLVLYSSFKKIIIDEKINNNFNFYTKLIANKSVGKKIKSKIKLKKSNINFKNYKRKLYSLEEYQSSNQNTHIKQKAIVEKNEWVMKGQVIADSSSTNNGKLAIGKNTLIGYVGWEGYNFEDAIVISEGLVKNNTFKSLHIKKYKTFLFNDETGEEKVTRFITNIDFKSVKNLKKNGIIKIGTSVENENILIGKIKTKKSQNLTSKLLSTLFSKSIKKDTSLRSPKETSGNILNIRILKMKFNYSIMISIIEKRQIKLGDKIAGRHGNKGIVSKILPIEDMPYLQDGTPLDILLNPLGIPSRMNVGQIFECLLGFAAKNLNENYEIPNFDEMNKKEVSRTIVYKKLYEARRKTGKNWVFDPNNPGKTKIFDGRTGTSLIQPVCIGYSYMLKLMHLVDDKLNARLTGPYSFIVKQPLKGKAKNGGQRFGEMEVWAIEGFGAAYTLQELMTLKSDDITNRSKALFSIMKSNPLPKPKVPESLKTLIIEMQCLCLDINILNNENEAFF